MRLHKRDFLKPNLASWKQETPIGGEFIVNKTADNDCQVAVGNSDILFDHILIQDLTINATDDKQI